MRYALKTPWRNGTTHVEFEPVEFIAKLAALVPPPRAHLTRFHGIFAPNAALRAQLTPSGRGKGATTEASVTADHRTPDAIRAILGHFARHAALPHAHFCRNPTLRRTIRA